jgi:hypothetical protein
MKGDVNMKPMSVTFHRLKPVVLLSVLWLAQLAQVSARDAYFDQGLDKIEQTLVRPIDTYGLTVTDVLQGASVRIGPLKEVFSFYTHGGNVQFTDETFDPRNPKAPANIRQSEVCGPGGADGKIADAVVDHSSNRLTNTLKVNVELKSFSVGTNGADSYAYYTDLVANSASPFGQPFQILANPCVAPLGLTPVELRKQTLKVLPEENECKVFELREKRYDDLMLLRLHFDPRHGDAVVKSEYGIVKLNDANEPEFITRDVRIIEEWQEANGKLVPARFHLVKESHGEVEIDLVREISKPIIGGIDQTLFDTTKLPAFNARWDRIVDMGRLYSGDPSAIQIPGPPSSPIRALFFWLNLAVVLVIAAVLFARRWLRTTAS